MNTNELASRLGFVKMQTANVEKLQDAFNSVSAVLSNELRRLDKERDALLAQIAAAQLPHVDAPTTAPNLQVKIFHSQNDDRTRWNNEPVLTTEQVAEYFGVPVVNIQRNFQRHQSRFILGKHYYKVEGADLEFLRVTFSYLQISPKTRVLYLWTRRGVARHAKMLETDKAWEIYEMLEDTYFNGSADNGTICPAVAVVAPHSVSELTDNNIYINGLPVIPSVQLADMLGLSSVQMLHSRVQKRPDQFVEGIHFFTFNAHDPEFQRLKAKYRHCANFPKRFAPRYTFWTATGVALHTKIHSEINGLECALTK